MGNTVSITKTILTAWSNYDNSIKTCQYVSGDELEIKPWCFYFQMTGKEILKINLIYQSGDTNLEIIVVSTLNSYMGQDKTI